MIDLIVKIQTFTNNQIKDRIVVLHKVLLILMLFAKRDSNPGEQRQKIKLEPFHYPVLTTTHVLFCFFVSKTTIRKALHKSGFCKKLSRLFFDEKIILKNINIWIFMPSFLQWAIATNHFFTINHFSKSSFLILYKNLKKNDFFLNLKYLIFRNFRL